MAFWSVNSSFWMLCSTIACPFFLFLLLKGMFTGHFLLSPHILPMSQCLIANDTDCLRVRGWEYQQKPPSIRKICDKCRNKKKKHAPSYTFYQKAMTEWWPSPPFSSSLHFDVCFFFRRGCTRNTWMCAIYKLLQPIPSGFDSFCVAHTNSQKSRFYHQNCNYSPWNAFQIGSFFFSRFSSPKKMNRFDSSRICSISELCDLKVGFLLWTDNIYCGCTLELAEKVLWVYLSW